MTDQSFIISRADLMEVFGNNPRIVGQFEELQRQVAEHGDTTSANIAATTALADASFLTLSPNADLTNEYVLNLGEGLRLVLENGIATLYLEAGIAVSGHALRFVTAGDTQLALPISGTVLTREFVPGPYADDTAAAGGGVGVGEVYRKGTASSFVLAARMA